MKVDLYKALTSGEPVWIDGQDFHALNYGEKYSKINGGRRKIGISGKEASYLSFTPEKIFPNGLSFQKRGPYMTLTEATHIGEYKTVRTDINLSSAVQLLKERGIVFEDQ